MNYPLRFKPSLTGRDCCIDSGQRPKAKSQIPHRYHLIPLGVLTIFNGGVFWQSSQGIGLLIIVMQGYIADIILVYRKDANKVIKNDNWIIEQSQNGMISPFEPTLIRNNVLSYGLSSYGYDIRLSPKEFLIFKHIPGTVVNPKNFNLENLESVPLHSDRYGDFFIIPAHSYGLGVALERLQMPPNVTAICLGKSTYARVGLIANITPVEAGWNGNLTLEFSNSSSADCRIYANEGIAQLLFFEGEPCLTTYGDRQGKYQNQSESVTLAKI